VKIGTTTNITERTTGLSLPLSCVVKVVPGGRAVEQQLHHRWRRFRVDGNREWFAVRGSLARFVGTSAQRRRIRNMGRWLRRGHASEALPTEDVHDVDLVSLREASADLGQGVVPVNFHALRRARLHDLEFPQPALVDGQTKRYRVVDLRVWQSNRPGTIRTESA
jgi:hypothetical protein